MSQSPSLSGMSSSGAGAGRSLEDGHITPVAFIKQLQKTHQETFEIIQLVLKVLKALADLMSYPALILFRRNLGERVLSSLAFLTVWFIAALVATASGVKPAYLLVVAFPVMYGLHTFKVKSRNKKGVRHYSYCRGDSWFDLVLPRYESFNRGVLEPAVMWFAALAIHLYSDALTLSPEVTNMRSEPIGAWVFSVYLAGMGLGLFFVEARLRQQHRNTILDHIDQQIIGTYFNAELNEQTEVPDEGFAVAELADLNPKQKERFAANLGLPVFNQETTVFTDQESSWNNLLDPLPTSAPTPAG
ncbi:MAG: hypothetical protein AAF086_05565 [Planctomycetota bacterium]